MKDGKFEVRDDVICIVAGHWPLTKGKRYVILKAYDDRVEVCDDLGEITTYYSYRFKLETARAYYIYKETPRYSGPVTIPAVALFQPEYFSALNEKDAEVYIGRTMEFADGSQVRNSDWLKGTLSEIKTVGSRPFHVIGASNYIFMRTCPETFQKKKVKKTVERWINIYPGGSEYSFTTESLANISAGPTRIVCVHISKEYEVEE
jgi:ribosomal protein L14E/L6E/L27E